MGVLGFIVYRVMSRVFLLSVNVIRIRAGPRVTVPS
jgi:hypothetical protein